MKKKVQKKEKAVVVTTARHGVFFGYVPTGANLEVDRITLKNCRMCVYWSADVKGVMGLAATGPSSSCRITPAAPSFSINEVTGVMVCTPQAAAAWEDAPWKE